jgi:hypothetical protein
MVKRLVTLAYGVKLTGDKRSSLFQQFVNYGREKINRIGPRANATTIPE